MKTCSILMLLAFSIERYIKTSENINTFINKFNHLSTRKLVITTLVFGFVTSICKLFEYDLGSGLKETLEVPGIVIYDELIKWWFAFTYASHYIINDLILLLVNLFVDLLLVSHIRKSLKIRELFTAEFGNTKEAILKKKKEKKSAESNTNKMIIYQIILIVLCRFPELIYAFHFFFTQTSTAIYATSQYKNFCVNLLFCSLMSNVIQFVYMISYSVNVYFFIKFNKPFKNALKDYLSLN